MKVVNLDKSEVILITTRYIYVPTSTIVKEVMENIVFLVLLLIILN